MAREAPDLNALVFFHEVVRSGSLHAASARLRVPPSTLSRRLRQLERQMGALLLKKSTRRLAPTDIGASLLEHCARISAEAEAAAQKAARMQTELQGTLRVAVPIEFGTGWLGRAIADFAVRYPDIQLEVDASGRPVDLIGESVDVAIALGQPKPSRLAFRRLGSLTSGLYASPAYLARRGTPRSLDEVPSHDCVATEIQERERLWLLRSQGRRRGILVAGRIRVNSIRLARELVIGGAGLGLLPHDMCRRHVASGQLVPVLPSWSSPALRIVALFLSRSSVPAKTRAFLDFVAAQLAHGS